MTDKPIPVEREGISWCKNFKMHKCTDACEMDKAIIPKLLEKEKHTDLPLDKYDHLITMMVVKKLGNPNSEEDVNRIKNIIKLL